MDYAGRPKSENRAKNGDGVLETREPVAAYYSGGGGSAIADPDEIGLDGEFSLNGDIAWEQEVIRKLLDGRAETLAGNTRPFNEAVDEILRDIEEMEELSENIEINDMLQDRMKNYDVSNNIPWKNVRKDI